MVRWLTVLIVAAALLWWVQAPSPIEQPPGVLVQSLPLQTLVEDQSPNGYQAFQLKPRATFSLEARILGMEHYRLGREADLAPLDLALGWGPMSDSAVLDQIKITQSNRFY